MLGKHSYRDGHQNMKQTQTKEWLRSETAEGSLGLQRILQERADDDGWKKEEHRNCPNSAGLLHHTPKGALDNWVGRREASNVRSCES